VRNLAAARISRWVQARGGFAKVLNITDPAYEAAERAFEMRARAGVQDAAGFREGML
jgi:hypothetical protein